MNRRCRSCHQHTHGAGPLASACLVDQLVHHHAEGSADGPGLYVQLIHALGDPARRDPGAPSAHRKPGSRPPGWRADISELLADMRSKGVGWRSVGWLGTQLDRDDLEQWVLQARIALGMVTPSVLLDQVACYRTVRLYVDGGWEDRQIGCGQVTLRVARDAQSDVWCGNPYCHDDAQHPNCRDLESPVDDLGYPIGLGYGSAPLVCRRSVRDLRHAIRWAREDWHRMWAGQAA